MVKFLLHGGYTNYRNKDNNDFYKEMTTGFSGDVRVLINCFARDEKQVVEKVKRHKERLLLHGVNKKLEFKVANLEEFDDQIRWSDVIYIDGGDTFQLVKKLSFSRNLEKLFEGKVVGGSSAGVYVLAKYFYSNDVGRIGKGLGILNIKAYCHYEPKDTQIVKKLTSYKEKLPLLILPNYKWVVMYK